VGSTALDRHPVSPERGDGPLLPNVTVGIALFGVESLEDAQHPCSAVGDPLDGRTGDEEVADVRVGSDVAGPVRVAGVGDEAAGVAALDERVLVTEAVETELVSGEWPAAVGASADSW
jgi:hypothetical protein